jgi:LysM repeat protein
LDQQELHLRKSAHYFKGHLGFSSLRGADEVRIFSAYGRRCLRSLAAGFIFSLLAGCTSNPGMTQPAQVSNLLAYMTNTAVILPSATSEPTQAPIPSSTPVIYTIVRNDTLSSIARHFKITVDALLAANPGTSPQALSVGQTLVIPPASAPASGQAFQVTPVPLMPGAGTCRPSGTGTTCLIPVHNPYPVALENIKLKVTLLDQNEQELLSQETVLPLNLLPADQVLPAVVHFDGVTSQLPPRVELLTAMQLAPADKRYLKTEIQNLLVSVDWNGLSANVQGGILLPATEKPARLLWLAAVAYGKNDQIIGVRRWEWSGTLQPGSVQPFSLPVYSLGPSIQRVELLVEARP